MGVETDRLDHALLGVELLLDLLQEEISTLILSATNVHNSAPIYSIHVCMCEMIFANYLQIMPKELQ